MERGKRSYDNMKMQIETGKPLNLNDQINAIGKGLLPTPMIGTPTRGMCRRSPEFAKGRIPNPVEYAQMWPTPKASDYKGTGPYGSKSQRHDAMKRNLKGSVSEYNNDGQLNPDWVEILMGYPFGWTDIEKEDLIFKDLPAAWLDGSWEKGIPRVISGQKNRVKRLKGLGNSVVPLIPALIWLLIKEILLTNGEGE